MGHGMDSEECIAFGHIEIRKEFFSGVSPKGIGNLKPDNAEGTLETWPCRAEEARMQTETEPERSK
jgi:hypothetical protein